MRQQKTEHRLNNPKNTTQNQCVVKCVLCRAHVLVGCGAEWKRDTIHRAREKVKEKVKEKEAIHFLTDCDVM